MKQTRQTSSFQKIYVLKNYTGSEKVSHSKSSYSRLSFCNQLIHYVSGITLGNDKYRRRNSQGITMRSSCWSHLTLIISGVCSSAWLTAWITVIFIGQFVSKINLTLSQCFRPVVKMGPQPRKASVILKRLLWC